jgi:hypothetical protein
MVFLFRAFGWIFMIIILFVVEVKMATAAAAASGRGTTDATTVSIPRFYLNVILLNKGKPFLVASRKFVYVTGGGHAAEWL